MITVIFRLEIGPFVHVSIDAIFIFSLSVEDDEHHFRVVFNRLPDASFHLSEKRFDVFSSSMDSIRCLINDRGLLADIDKIFLVRN